MTLPSQEALARIVPFAVYIAFLVVESALPASAGGHWLYLTQVGVVGALLAFFWRRYVELRRPGETPWRDWALGAVVGAVVFLLWINLDFAWAQFGAGRGVSATVTGRGVDGLGTSVRLLGAVAVVPMMEELFWRSFLMRWLEKGEFLEVGPKQVSVRSLFIVSLVFALEHHLWLAGLVAGLAYGLLYMRLGRLGPVILAHALTNAMLEIYVHATGDWHFL